MQKPVNKFALFVWVIAVLLFVTDIPATLALKRMLEETKYPGGPAMAFAISWQNVWMYVRSATISSVQLASFGVLIELLDQIRWNALPPEARVSPHKSRWLWFLRNWPHSSGN